MYDHSTCERVLCKVAFLYISGGKNVVYLKNLLDLLVLQLISELSKVFGSFQLNLAL